MKNFTLNIIPALLVMLLSLTACGGSSNDNNEDENRENGNIDINPTGRTLVVYFSQTLPEGVDATTGATNVVREGNNNYGVNQYLALTIASRANADTLRLTVRSGYYPVEYSELATFARNERDSSTHPALTSRRVNMSDYDNIIISTPVWWYTLPMPVRSFLDNYDLSGKRVFVATTHAGSGLADAISVIRSQEPNATVSADGLAVSAGSSASTITTNVETWLRRIGF